MRQTLKAVHGVTDAEVSYDTERAKVHYDPNTVTPEQLVQAVNNTGFRASLTGKVDAEGVGSSLYLGQRGRRLAKGFPG